MRSTPPLRRSARRPPRDEEGLPLVPILIGVIVLGFVIGAGWSLLSNRHANRTNVAMVATPLPNALPTVTPVPLPSPSAASTATAAATYTAVKRTPTVRHTLRGSAATPVASRGFARAARGLPARLRGTASLPVAFHPTPSATASAIVPTARESSNAAPPSAPTKMLQATATAAATPAFQQLAADVVRQYLEAIARGDTSAAYAALGAGPNGQGGTLTEQGIVDERTQIKSVEASGTSDTATVEVDLETPGGAYYGDYTVRKNDTGAAVIVAHSLIKP